MSFKILQGVDFGLGWVLPDPVTPKYINHID